jgi:hypothetical protein
MNKEFLKMQKMAGVITEGQFKRLNENEDNDDRFTIIDDLVDRELYNNFINAVEAIQNVTIGQSGITPEDVYEYLTLSMERDA